MFPKETVDIILGDSPIIELVSFDLTRMNEIFMLSISLQNYRGVYNSIFPPGGGKEIKGHKRGEGKKGRVKPFFRDKSGIFPLKIGHIIFWTLSVPNIPDICTMLDNVSNIRFLNKQT